MATKKVTKTKKAAPKSSKVVKKTASAKGRSSSGRKSSTLRQAQGKKATKEASQKKVEAKATTHVEAGLKVDVYNAQGKVKGTITLSKEIFDAKVNKPLMAQAVRVYLVNQRAGSASTKTRGEVTGSTRKIYRQKGTGRARHGGIRAPIFVKGGIAHGPKPKEFELSLSKNMKRAAFVSALTSKRKGGEIRIVNGFEKIEPKTKLVALALSHMEIKKGTPVLFVIPKKSENVERAVRNIDGLDIAMANTLNTYQVLQHKMLILMEDSLGVIEKTFIKEE